MFGFGAWVPFLPHHLAAKLAALDVLETLQDMIAGAVHKAWPAPRYEARAEIVGDAIRLWFERDDGETRPVGVVSVNTRTG
jgi:hypothetical protein